jgi:hypothetical protein
MGDQWAAPVERAGARAEFAAPAGLVSKLKPPPEEALAAALPGPNARMKFAAMVPLHQWLAEHFWLYRTTKTKNAAEVGKQTSGWDGWVKQRMPSRREDREGPAYRLSSSWGRGVQAALRNVHKNER